MTINSELILALTAIIVSIISLMIQRRHNKLTVRPIPYVAHNNYRNQLYIRLHNKGTGPMIIKSVEFSLNNIVKNSIIEHIPSGLEEKTHYYNYAEHYKYKALVAGDVITIFNLKLDKNEFQTLVEHREIMTGMKVTVTYTDVYGGYQQSDPFELIFKPRSEKKINAQREGL